MLLLAGVSNFSSVHGLTLLTGLLKLNGHGRNHRRRTWATVNGAEGGVQPFGGSNILKIVFLLKFWRSTMNRENHTQKILPHYLKW